MRYTWFKCAIFQTLCNHKKASGPYPELHESVSHTPRLSTRYFDLHPVFVCSWKSDDQNARILHILQMFECTACCTHLALIIQTIIGEQESTLRSCEYGNQYYFKYSQKDTTLHNILYYCQCSPYLGRFLRPSSGAQKNCTHCIGYVSCLLAANAGVGESEQLDIYPMQCLQFFELLMMGGETAQNIYSIDSNKE